MFDVKGAKPQWELVYDLFHGKPVDYVVTYDELSEALGFDFQISSRKPVYKATEVLQREDRRTIVSVKNEGYRVATAREHALLAEGRRRKAHRQVRRGKNTVMNVRDDELAPEDARYKDAVLLRISALESFEASQRTHNIKMKAALASTTGQVVEQDQKLDRLIEQLKDKGFI